MSIEVFKAQDCYSASYGALLGSAGLDPMVLGGQWGMTWWRDATRLLGRVRITPADIHADIHSWYSVDLVTNDHADADTVLRFFASPEAIPAIVAVDSFHLPYSSTYQRMHYPHAVVLTGIGDGGARVVDGYRGYSFDGEVELGSMKAALASRAAHGPGADELLTCHDEPPHAECVPAVHLINRQPGQRPTAAQVTGQLHRILDLPRDGEASGPDAIAAIEQALRAGADDADPEGLVEVLSLFGTLASHRAFNADFLDWAARLTRIPALTDAADIARDAAGRWNRLRNTVFLRASAAQGGVSAVLHRAADSLPLLTDLESRLYASLGAGLAEGHAAVNAQSAIEVSGLR